MPDLAYKYAGILGTLAMSVVLLRAIPASGGSASLLWTATVCLVLFSMAWLVLGWVADATVVGAVRMQFEEQLQEERGRGAESKTSAA